MNPENYCTQPYAQKLIDNGIVLDTDFYWTKKSFFTEEWELGIDIEGFVHLPAPCFTEVWRELPENTWLRKSEGNSVKIMNADNSYYGYNENLANAAIDLLIFVNRVDTPK